MQNSRPVTRDNMTNLVTLLSGKGEGPISWDSIYMRVQNRQVHTDRKCISGCQGVREGRELGPTVNETHSMCGDRNF